VELKPKSASVSFAAAASAAAAAASAGASDCFIYPEKMNNHDLVPLIPVNTIPVTTPQHRKLDKTSC
jgi:hypothetical protein